MLGGLTKMSYLEEIALMDSKKVRNQLAEEGFDQIAILKLLYPSKLYRVMEDNQRIFGLKMIVNDREIKEVIERGGAQYKATMKQRRGDKTFKIYHGGR